jgi:hypothetical protein
MLSISLTINIHYILSQWHLIRYHIHYRLFLWVFNDILVGVLLIVLFDGIIFKNNLKFVLKKLKSQLEIVNLNDVLIPEFQLTEMRSRVPESPSFYLCITA